MSRSAPRRETPPYDLTLAVVRVRRALWRATDRALTAAGETMPVWQILSYLSRAGTVCQKDMAEHLALDPASISRSLDALEKDGTVSRTRDAGDRRKVMVVLTADGRRRHAKLFPLVRKVSEDVFEPLEADERATLEGLLARCAPMAAEAAPAPAPEAPAPPRPPAAPPARTPRPPRSRRGA